MDRIDFGMTPATYLARAYAPAQPNRAGGAGQGTSPQGPAFGQSAGPTVGRIGPGSGVDTFQFSAAQAPRWSPVSTPDPTPTVPESIAERIASLVAAKVPGSADFAASETPRNPNAQTVPLYRHPADRNTIATAVHAGRILDVNA